MDAADLEDKRLSIADKGSPGWLSDEAMKVLKGTLKSLTELRAKNLSKILDNAEAKVVAKCKELRISDKWMQKHLQIDKSLGVQTLDYLEILFSRLRSASQLARSLNPLTYQVQLFKISVERKEKVHPDFSKKEFPLVLRTLTYLMAEIKKHRAKDYDDICLMLSLPRLKDIERLEMLVNFSRETKKKEEKKPQALRRPTLGGRSSLFANNQNQNQAAPAEGLAPTEVKVPSPPLGLVKKRPKRKKRASVVGM